MASGVEGMLAPSLTSVHPVFDQVGRILFVDFILGGAGEGTVGLVVPEGIVIQVPSVSTYRWPRSICRYIR